MKNFIRSIADIRRDEIGVTLLMLANVMAILMTYYLLKPARDSLFLSRQSAEELPWVFILTALASAPVVGLYSKAGKSLVLHRLVNLTMLLIIAFLVGFYFFIKLPYPWVPYTFYIWVSIYGALTTSQFWLLANGVYTPAQAKRIFPFLGLGAIVGAWIGGELTAIILHQFDKRGLGLENLLFFCAALLLLSVLLTNVISHRKREEIEQESRRLRQSREPADESYGELFRTIKRSRHLLLVVGIVSLTMMVASFVDFQFKAVAKNAFETPQELGAFFGQFYGRLSLVSFFLQLFLSYTILRKLGVGGIILFLPLGLLIGSVAMLLSAGLVAAVLLRGADGAIKYSLDKTGRELLFLPVPLAVKKKTKVFIDVLVDRWFRGVAGALLLFCVWIFGFDGKNPLATMPLFSIVVVGLLLIWIVMALIMRREYVNTFRRALERRTIDPAEIRIDISESSTLKTLINSLHASSPREVAYALEMLESVRDRQIVEHVTPLLSHEEADIRRKALSVLKTAGDASVRPSIEFLLQDSDPDVRREAFHFMYLMSDDRDALLNAYLSHEDPALRSSAVAAVAEYGNAVEKQRIDVDLVHALLNEKVNPAAFRMEVAHALGHLPGRTDLKAHLHELLDDKSPLVLRAALESAGKLRDREFLPKIISSLAHIHVRSDARQALVAYGTAILGTLNDYLLDSGVDLRIWRNLPRVLADIAHQQSVHILTSALGAVPPEMKYHIVKALNKLRSKHPELSFDEQVVDEALIAETRTYYETMHVLHVCGQTDDRSAPTKLLCRALSERLDQNLERIFRLLGLAYPPNDIYSAYLGIRSERKDLRDSAVEFLDNLLHNNLKRYLLPIVDHVSVERTIEQGRHLFGVDLRSRADALRFLIHASDPWLRACAIYAAGKDGAGELIEDIEEARGDSDPIVRETADLVVRMIGASNRGAS